MDVELTKLTETGAVFKALGIVGDAQAVAARIEIAYFNLADRHPTLGEIDKKLTAHHRVRWALIAPTEGSSNEVAAEISL